MNKAQLAGLTAVLALAAASSGCSGDAGESDGKTGAAPKAAASGPPTAQAFFLRGNDQDEYVPESFSAKVGTLALTLKNGSVPHNLVFDDDSLPGIPIISGEQTETARITFAKPGTYTFVCTIHPGMDGSVVVS